MSRLDCSSKINSTCFYHDFYFILYIFFLLSTLPRNCSFLFFPFTFRLDSQFLYTEPSSRLWYPFCISNGTKKHFWMINIFYYRRTFFTRFLSLLLAKFQCGVSLCFFFWRKSKFFSFLPTIKKGRRRRRRKKSSMAYRKSW